MIVPDKQYYHFKQATKQAEEECQEAQAQMESQHRQPQGDPPRELNRIVRIHIHDEDGSD